MVDDRIVLEIDSVEYKNDSWEVKFFLSKQDEKKITELIKPFESKLFKNYKIFNLDEIESVLYTRLNEIKTKDPKDIIYNILKDDNEAILQSQIEDSTLKELCMFKFKVMKFEHFGHGILEEVELYDDED